MPTDLPVPAHTVETATEAATADTLYLPPSRNRWTLTLVVSLLIVALDVFLIVRQGSVAVWALVAVFSCTALLAASQLIPGGGGLSLDRDGFSMKVAFFTRRHRWSEITPVEASSAGLFQLVGYRMVGEPLTKPREVLPETYGLGAFELARVMNYWRDRALGIEPTAPAPVGPEPIFDPEDAPL
jgi:hypothetical protein